MPKSDIRCSVCPLFSPPRHALVLMGHDLDVTNTWPQPLLEDRAGTVSPKVFHGFHDIHMIHLNTFKGF